MTVEPTSRVRVHPRPPVDSVNSRVMPRTASRNPIARWYEQTTRPGALLLLVVFGLYAPSLRDGFMLDDHRAMRILREYTAGERPEPDVYRFLAGEADANRREREDGCYAWWIADDLKYQHMRPLAEWLLYAEYRVFGESPIGYRLVSLLLYVAGVLLVLRLFRLLADDERLARWGAMIFAVMGSHSIPVLFVSSQGDVIAVVCVATAVLAAGHFVKAGGLGRLALFVSMFATGLGMKEAVLPVAAAPVLFWLFKRSSQGAAGRAVLSTALASAISLVWLAMYVRSGFGSNTSVMLDPIHDPMDYLRALPLRSLLLLSSWVIPINPFLFEFQIELRPYQGLYALMGGATLAALAIMYWRHHRRQQGVAMMALWVLIFLPILVCTPPDDRVMILPSIGLAFLGAAWLARPHADGALRLRRIPLLLFVGLQIVTVVATSRILAYLESQSQLHVRVMAAAFERPMGEGDHMFVLNNPYSFEGLFMQDRLRSQPGLADASSAVLSDVRDPTITVMDSHALRLEAGKNPFFSSFLGRMGTTRTRPKQAGDRLSSGEIEATILKADEHGVQSVELRFKQPLASERYRFFLVQEDGSPTIWKPDSPHG